MIIPQTNNKENIFNDKNLKTVFNFVCSEANINSDCLKPGNNKAFRQIFLSNFS